MDIVILTLPCAAVETAIAWYTSCCAMARGHCLNILVVLAVVHCLLGLPGWCTQSSLYSLAPCPPPPPIPIPNKQPCFCGHEAKCLLTYYKRCHSIFVVVVLLCPLQETGVAFLGMTQQLKEQHYPLLSVCAVVSLCPNNGMAASLGER